MKGRTGTGPNPHRIRALPAQDPHGDPHGDRTGTRTVLDQCSRVENASGGALD